MKMLSQMLLIKMGEYLYILSPHLFSSLQDPIASTVLSRFSSLSHSLSKYNKITESDACVTVQIAYFCDVQVKGKTSGLNRFERKEAIKLCVLSDFGGNLGV